MFLPFLPIDIDENKEKEANARWTCCTTCKNKRCKREADWVDGNTKAGKGGVKCK
jgi:hypothetical protein